MAGLRRQAWRFLLVGGSNTVGTFVLLALLAAVIDPRLAYSVAFGSGVAYSTLLTGRFVFAGNHSHGRNLRYAGWYLVVYAVGLTVLQVLHAMGVRSSIALAAITVLATAPLSFAGGRLIFHRPDTSGQQRARSKT